MEILPIFAPYLYAVKYENEALDELERLFDEWSDIEKLESFFETNYEDLKYFKIDVDEAILESIKEANAFRHKILELAKKENPDLDSIFKNLDNKEVRIFELIKQKSKRRWLRIYAIRIDTNVYLITGGAIKLTLQMADRLHTQKELDKLERCRNYLKDNQVFDNDSFKEMLNENL
jgi:hypothetical protein